MKKITKILSSVLAVSMLATCCAMNAFAASTAHTMTLSADKTTDLKAGDVVTLTITIDGTANLAAVGYRLSYDASVFEIDTTMGEYYEKYIDEEWYYTAFEDSRGAYKNFAKNYTTTKKEDTANGYLTYSWYTDASVTTNYADFELGKFYFTVKDGASATQPVVFELVDDLAVTYSGDYGENSTAAITANDVEVTLLAVEEPKTDAAVAAPSNIAYSDKYLDGEVERVNAAFETEVTFEENSNPVKGIKVTGPAGSADVTLNTVIRSAGSVKVYINVLGVPFGKDITGITLAPINE